MKKFLFAAALAFAASAFANTDWVAGEVVKVDPARKIVTLKHERIPSIDMDAMTMPFKVKDATQLKTLKIGDKVHFHVIVEDGELFLHHLEVQR
jgi:Cu(I)/Ag(I) efflux system periplasmic protein CusF